MDFSNCLLCSSLLQSAMNLVKKTAQSFKGRSTSVLTMQLFPQLHCGQISKPKCSFVKGSLTIRIPFKEECQPLQGIPFPKILKVRMTGGILFIKISSCLWYTLLECIEKLKYLSARSQANLGMKAFDNSCLNSLQC